jgi:hypothetical protein
MSRASSSPFSSSIPLPRLPIELQLYILLLSVPIDTVATRIARQTHLQTVSLVHSSWTSTAHRSLFSSVAFDLRHPGEKAEEVRARWVERMGGLRALGYEAKRLNVRLDDTSGPLMAPAPRPWSSKVVEDNPKVEELCLELLAHPGSGINVWDIEVFSPLMPGSSFLPSLYLTLSHALLPTGLQKLSLRNGQSFQGYSSVPQFDADNFSSTHNLTRLVLDNVAFIGWFPPGAFPSVRCLLLRGFHITPTSNRPSPADDLFLPFPSLRTTALLAGGHASFESERSFAQAPATLKHLLVGHLCNGFGPDLRQLLHLLPCHLDSLSLVPVSQDGDQDTLDIASLAELVSAAPSCLFSLKKLVTPPRSQWIDESSDEDAHYFRVLEQNCQQRNVDWMWRTEEQAEAFRLEEWGKDEL